MKKLSVLTIVGTRPEIIRLSSVIVRLDLFCDHVLVHTGQNYDYELNQVFFNELGLNSPDYFLNAATGNPLKTMGEILIKFEQLLEDLPAKPDAVLVLGDTNSAIAILAAKRRKIPTFHMEAGNRCFDQRVPEEINRKLVDHIADVNLTYSSIARDYLLSEGLDKELVIKTGSPMFEVLNKFKREISNSKILEKLKVKKRNYFLISLHREENLENEKLFTSFLSVLEKLALEFKLPIIVSTHPRTRKRISTSKVSFNKLIRFEKPFGFYDYIYLQKNSKLTLSDSGTINEESSILNFPAINLREAHERPEANEESCSIMTGLNEERIFQAINILNSQDGSYAKDSEHRIVSDYAIPDVSEKVLRIILSYTDYVNRKVWKKY